MWKKIKDNFVAGVEKIKWFAAFFSERLKVEFSLLKLLQERDGKEKIRADKMRLIGEHVFELRNNPEKNIFKDKAIADSMSEIEGLETEIEDIKKKVLEISKMVGSDPTREG